MHLCLDLTRSLRRSFVRLLALSATCLSVGSLAYSQTTATYTTSLLSPQTSNLVSATAQFSIIAPGTLQIDLTNTSPGTGQNNRGDLFGTLLFNFSGVTVAPTMNGAGNVTTSLLSPNTVINSNNTTTYTTGVNPQAVNGSWVFGIQTDGDRAFNYGISASGFGNTGTGGTVNATANGTAAYGFASSGMTLGGGGDDYMLVRPILTGVNGQNLPVIKNSVRLTVTNLNNLTSTSQITSVGFGFASGAFVTNGTGKYNIGIGELDPDGGNQAVPEPGTFALVALGVLGTVAARRYKR